MLYSITSWKLNITFVNVGIAGRLAFVNGMGCECCCWNNVLHIKLQLNLSHLLGLDLHFKSINNHGRAVLIHAVIFFQFISAASLSFSHIWAKSLQWETVHFCEPSSSHSVIFKGYYHGAVCVSGLVKHYNLQILLHRFPPKPCHYQSLLSSDLLISQQQVIQIKYAFLKRSICFVLNLKLVK